MTDKTMPATHAAVIVVATPYEEARALYVGVGGDIEATVNGIDITFKGAAAGSIIPVSTTNIVSATATDLVALY